MTAHQDRVRALRTSDPAVEEATARYEIAVASLLRARGAPERDRAMREAALAASVALIQNARRMGVRA